MAQSSVDLSRYTRGLIYDADSVTLIGKYSDELSTHRAKKNWVELFSSYFLLEPERDYTIRVDTSISKNHYVLSCIFTSACGRYAFWRLVNQQAPDAEKQLGRTIVMNGKMQRADHIRTEDECTVWICGALDEQIRQTRETQNLLDRIIKLFQ